MSSGLVMEWQKWHSTPSASPDWRPEPSVGVERPAIEVRPTSTSVTSDVAFDSNTAAGPEAFLSLQPDAGADLKTITVSTFIADDMDDPETGVPAAVTQLTLDGDLETILSQEVATGDEHVLTLHQAMVREAIEARLAYLELLTLSEVEGE